MKIFVENEKMFKEQNGKIIGNWLELPAYVSDIKAFLRDKVDLQLTKKEKEKALKTKGYYCDTYTIPNYYWDLNFKFDDNQIVNADIYMLNVLAKLIKKCKRIDDINLYLNSSEGKNVKTVENLCNLFLQENLFDFSLIKDWSKKDYGVSKEKFIGETFITWFYDDLWKFKATNPDEFEKYIDYESLGKNIADNFNKKSFSTAAKYYCGNENATDEQIGKAYVNLFGLDDFNSKDYMNIIFDYEMFGKHLIDTKYFETIENENNLYIFKINKDIDLNCHSQKELLAWFNKKKKIKQIL